MPLGLILVQLIWLHSFQLIQLCYWMKRGWRTYTAPTTVESAATFKWNQLFAWGSNHRPTWGANILQFIKRKALRLLISLRVGRTVFQSLSHRRYSSEHRIKASSLWMFNVDKSLYLIGLKKLLVKQFSGNIILILFQYSPLRHAELN